MQKIISLFQRNYTGDRLVRDEVVPGAEWVINGEGVATRKFDGTSCLIQGGRFYKRYDAKKGKTPPAGFIPAQPEPDEVSGHWPGWVEVSDTNPQDRWHREAWERMKENYGFLRQEIPQGTYELVGPKVQSNHEKFEQHFLIKHGEDKLIPEPSRTFKGIEYYLQNHNIEGIVWHHPDGRMVKIKAKDFGIKRY